MTATVPIAAANKVPASTPTRVRRAASTAPVDTRAQRGTALQRAHHSKAQQWQGKAVF